MYISTMYLSTTYIQASLVTSRKSKHKKDTYAHPETYPCATTLRKAQQRFRHEG
jgi:hypothetical protein